MLCYTVRGPGGLCPPADVCRAGADADVGEADPEGPRRNNSNNNNHHHHTDTTTTTTTNNNNNNNDNKLRPFWLKVKGGG